MIEFLIDNYLFLIVLSTIVTIWGFVRSDSIKKIEGVMSIIIENGRVLYQIFSVWIVTLLIGRILFVIDNWNLFRMLDYFYLPYERFGDTVYLFRAMPWNIFAFWQQNLQPHYLLTIFFFTLFVYLVNTKYYQIKDYINLYYLLFLLYLIVLTMVERVDYLYIFISWLIVFLIILTVYSFIPINSYLRFIIYIVLFLSICILGVVFHPYIFSYLFILMNSITVISLLIVDYMWNIYSNKSLINSREVNP